jgi:hypothetical protein
LSTGLVDRGYLRLERRRRDWAALSRSIKILQCHTRRVESGKLRRRGIIFREGDGYDRVIEDVTCCDICIQILKMLAVRVGRRAKETRRVRRVLVFVLTLMNVARSGGQSQGTLMD